MNLSKLILLNRRQWWENRRAYAVGLLAITGILLFLFLVVRHWRDSFAGGVQKGIFLIGLFGGGCIFASLLLKDLRSTAKGTWFIGLPAGAVEKVLVAAVYATIIYLVAYLALFYITEGFFLWMVKQDNAPIEHTDLLYNGFYNFLFTFIDFQLFVLLGCQFFNKSALLKTILIMIVFFSASYNGNNYLLMRISGEKSINGGTIFNYFQFSYAGENIYVYLPVNVQLVVTIFFNYLLPLILFYIIYLKFRETEL
jgi:hypothetical protein